MSLRCGTDDLLRSQAEVATAWLEGLLTATGAARRGPKWQCPCHGADGDHTVSLNVKPGRQGAVVYCHGGCTTDEVLSALSLRREHLFTPPPQRPKLYALSYLRHLRFPPPKAGSTGGSPAQRGFRHEAFHYYGDRWRKERLRRPTDREKEFVWETRDAAGAWISGLRGATEATLPLYREAEQQLTMERSGSESPNNRSKL
jgi:hypothetical protein